MKTGNYDGVSASGDATLRLPSAGGDVAPVNTDLVPNYEDVFDALKDQPFNTVDGVNDGIPHGRGANLLMWNTDDDQGQRSTAGRPCSMTTATAVQGQAHGLRQPDLHRRRGGVPAGDAAGARDREPLRARRGPVQRRCRPAEAAAREHRRVLVRLHRGAERVRERRQSRSARRGRSIANLLEADDVPVEDRPAQGGRDGLVGHLDDLVRGEAPELHVHVVRLGGLARRCNAQIAEYFGEAPANAKACDETADPKHCDIYHADDEQYFDQIEYWNTPKADCGDDRGDVCKDYSEWVAGLDRDKGVEG